MTPLLGQVVLGYHRQDALAKLRAIAHDTNLISIVRGPIDESFTPSKIKFCTLEWPTRFRLGNSVHLGIHIRKEEFTVGAPQ
mmetsp:Transcript_1208/g.2545  ORF Transcript_1208/g.2545 Transcript_1208/m.2545 type:complete len:82 (-) Transcript_1208:55-300(-)